MNFGHQIFDMQRRWFLAVQYLVHPPELPLQPTPFEVIHKENKLRLLHYAALKPNGQAPILIVYSLINRYYILDLLPERSVIQFLTRAGFDVYLIDWGAPDRADRFLDLEALISGLLHRAVQKALDHARADRIAMLGYCMGGTLAAIYSALNPQFISKLIMLASPIDFDKGGKLRDWADAGRFNAALLVEAYENMPQEIMQSSFIWLNPLSHVQKLRALVQNVDDMDYLINFFAMEKWVSDNVDFPGRLYVEYIEQLYQKNLLVAARLKIGSRRVDLSQITQPLLIITATKDHIVPPDCALALREKVSSTDISCFDHPSGHIGVSVGAKAFQVLWPRVAGWIGSH